MGHPVIDLTILCVGLCWRVICLYRVWYSFAWEMSALIYSFYMQFLEVAYCADVQGIYD